jgi:hypothetical protein
VPLLRLDVRAPLRAEYLARPDAHEEAGWHGADGIAGATRTAIPDEVSWNGRAADLAGGRSVMVVPTVTFDG